MFDFPNSPFNGQVVLGPNGSQFRYDGVKYVAIGGHFVPQLSATNDVAVINANNTNWQYPTIAGNVTPTAPGFDGLGISATRLAVADANGSWVHDPSMWFYGAASSYAPNSIELYASGTNGFIGFYTTGNTWTFNTNGVTTFPGNQRFDTGGTLYTPGRNDPFNIVVDNGLYARIGYTITGKSFWHVGLDQNGAFGIADEGAGAYRFWIYPDGHADFAGNNVYAGYFEAANMQANDSINATNNVQGNWLHSRGDVIADANMGCQGLYGSYVHSSGDVSADVNVHASQHMYIHGGLGVLYTNFTGTWVAFGWNGRVQCWLDGGNAYVEMRTTGDYQPNQNVDNGVSPTFGDLYINGTIHAGNSYTEQAGIRTYATSGSWFGFWVSGNGYMRMDGTYDYYMPYASDARLKQDIMPTEVNCLAMVNKFDLVKFNWREDIPTNPKGSKRSVSIGFTTQQLKSICMDAVVTAPDDLPPYIDYEKGEPIPGATFHEKIDTNAMLALLVGSVQQLSKRLDAGGL